MGVKKKKKKNMAKSMKKPTKAMKKNAMKKAMKKTMKTMKKKAMKKRVSKIARGRGAKAKVFYGKKESTTSGLKKTDLVLNKKGKVVSKKSSARAKKTFQRNGLAKWTKAVQQAKKILGMKGFQIIGGKTAKGQALLKKARSLYKK